MKKNLQELYPVAMTISESDSGGSSGIQADLRTFNAFGVFGCSAITAVTSQNPFELSRIDNISPEGIASQIGAICKRIKVDVAKTGMLANKAIIYAVAAEVKKMPIPLIVDPVLFDSNGAPLLDADAVKTLSDSLLPLASWIMPGIAEAELLLGRRFGSEAECLSAAKECAKRYDCHCWLRGNCKEPDKIAADFIALPDGNSFKISSPIVPNSKAGHGAACTLSAALAAAIALDYSWKRAACCAKAFVFGSLSEPINPGIGVEAMYPPTEDYYSAVKLEQLK